MIKTSVITSERVNPSETREPRPVQVRLYQLKNDTRFLNANFEQIWRTDAEVLGDDLLKVDEVPVYPNSRTQVSLEREGGARFLVAAGLFRNPKGKSWFTSFEFPEPSLAFCEGANGETPPPEFFVWVEDTRVEDGLAHAEEFPDGRVVQVTPAPAAAEATETQGGGSSPKAPSAVPNVQGPSVPSVPTPVVPSAAVPSAAVPSAAVPSPAVPSASTPKIGGGLATELQ